jgi:hypothetical protein
MIRKGDKVWMVTPNRERHARIRMGTRGVVMASRIDDGETVYLVKFEGAANPRHTLASEIMPNLSETVM